jgi:hypothetical protein
MQELDQRPLLLESDIMRTISTPAILGTLVLGLMGCSGVAERSDCGIAQREAEKYLGGPVKYIDRSDPRLQLSDADKKNSRVKACGFETDDGSMILLQQNEFESEAEAKQSYEFWKDYLPRSEKKNAGDYWEDEMFAVYGDGFMVHANQADGKHTDIAGRVEKKVFALRTVGARSNKTYSRLLIKGFGVRLGEQFAKTR